MMQWYHIYALLVNPNEIFKNKQIFKFIKKCKVQICKVLCKKYILHALKYNFFFNLVLNHVNISQMSIRLNIVCDIISGSLSLLEYAKRYYDIDNINQLFLCSIEINVFLIMTLHA